MLAGVRHGQQDILTCHNWKSTGVNKMSEFHIAASFSGSWCCARCLTVMAVVQMKRPVSEMVSFISIIFINYFPLIFLLFNRLRLKLKPSPMSLGVRQSEGCTSPTQPQSRLSPPGPERA